MVLSTRYNTILTLKRDFPLFLICIICIYQNIFMLKTPFMPVFLALLPTLKQSHYMTGGPTGRLITWWWNSFYGRWRDAKQTTEAIHHQFEAAMMLACDMFSDVDRILLSYSIMSCNSRPIQLFFSLIQSMEDAQIGENVLVGKLLLI